MDKHWMYPIFIIGFTVLTLLLCETCLGESVETHQDAVKIANQLELPVQNHQDAIEIANKFTGFKELPNFSDVVITVQRVVIEEDNTVLYEWIEGRSFWKVSYANIILPLTVINQRPGRVEAFDVFVDIETGQVPKIASQWMPGLDPRYKETQHRLDEERKRFRISRRKEKKQYTVPEILPKVSFLEAYKAMPIDSRVKYIEVVYMYDLKDCGEKGEFLVPVWCIKCYGGRGSVTPPASFAVENRTIDRSDSMIYRFFWIDAVNVRQPLYAFHEEEGGKKLILKE